VIEYYEAPGSEGAATAAYATYSFIGGHDVTWGSGALYPDYTYLRPEFGYAGDSFNGPSYLAERMIMNNTVEGHNLDDDFENARSYYASLSQNFALEVDNVVSSVQWSGLFLDCTGATETSNGLPRYIITLDADIFASISWYSLVNCSSEGVWIINIGGTDDVTFQGGDFPGISERVLFNVLGSGRTINVASGVAGNILGPNNYFSQTGGVTHGLVIVGDILASLSATNPNCYDFQAYDIVTVTTSSINSGDTSIDVANNDNFATGDSLNLGGTQNVTITGLFVINGQDVITVNPPSSGDYGSGTFLTTTVPNPTFNNRTVTPPTVIDQSSSNGSSILSAAFALLIAALIYTLF